MNSTRRSHLCYFIALSYLSMLFVARATLLPNSEVDALKEIWQRLGKKDWDFEVDPCSDQHKRPIPPDVFNNDVVNNVTCNCTVTVCHVVSIVLKSQSLPGVLPPELVKLPYLQAIDLTRNYLNGSIPKEWGSMQLLNISLVGNRISGPVPVELGNISTLKLLELDFNQLSGALPHELGNMTSIEKLVLRGQDLSGVLPPELPKLPFLQQIDLIRNYLNGTIPKEWGLMKLVNISLDANRLSGGLPIELANIPTLVRLTLDSNFFSGVLPSELGNMASIEILSMNSNNFTGPLPESFAKLTTLTYFRINDNQFTGKIPEFIQNWTNVTKIAMQASGLQGPIPLGISRLAKMSDMRISDLTGLDFAFPPLNNMTNLTKLVLRSCNIIGGVPSFLFNLTQLRILDLSFNKLIGQLPGSISNLRTVNFLYLTGNLLNGPVPAFTYVDSDVNINIDLSYNNFTLQSGNPCQLYHQVNVFGSSSLGNNTTGIIPCLKSFRCHSNPSSSFHINCGGPDVNASGGMYIDNTEPTSSTRFIEKTGNNWGFSTTGDFMDNGVTNDSYIATTNSSLTMKDSDLYTSARISPISLTYYGLCLINGSYTVSLHFAEIKIADDNTFQSLGRRIFDIYIQGKRVRKDFNIKHEAGGANKAIIRQFTAVVSDGTLDIRFYWAGKGTTDIPFLGTYGPLVSAISVVPENGNTTVSVGMIAGIVIGVLGLIVIALVLLWWIGCFSRKNEIDKDLRGLRLHTGTFTLRQIKAATNNFHPENKIGEGGFGPVYKGHLLDGTVIAVKQLSSKSKQGNREFVNEIGMISVMQHPNLVRLYGCCIEGNQLLVVYEFMENNSLASVLFDPEECQSKLDWRARHRICVDIARALAHLHEGSRIKIIHRDIKATNILLDKDLNAKVSDFGLAKLDEEDASHISTEITGTRGYMAPEYAMRGHLTEKADVYSFGVLLLEIVSGRSHTKLTANEECVHLLDWAVSLQRNGDLIELLDPKLESNYIKEEVMVIIDLALQCTNRWPNLRPTMSFVLSGLETSTNIHDMVPNANMSNDELQVYNRSISQSENTMLDGSWTG